MLQVNGLEIVKDKMIILRISEMTLSSSSINALYGEEKSGKSLLSRTLHGLYSNYRGHLDFFASSKQKNNSYLITKDVHLLQHKSVRDNLNFCAKDHFEAIREYSFLADLDNDLDYKIYNLPLHKQKLVELSIACGFNPELLIIDDFDKSFTKQGLSLAGKLLTKFKADGGTALLTSTLKIPEMDSSFEIINGKVENYEK